MNSEECEILFEDEDRDRFIVKEVKSKREFALDGKDNILIEHFRTDKQCKYYREIKGIGRIVVCCEDYRHEKPITIQIFRN